MWDALNFNRISLFVFARLQTAYLNIMNTKNTILIGLMLVCLVFCQNAVAITKTYCVIPKNPKQTIYEVAVRFNFKQVKLLVKLADAESGLGSVMRVLDVNDKYSTGLYHMQEGFWQDHCAWRFDEPNIWSLEQQTECVIKVVKEEGIEFVESTGGWYNSCVRINCKQLYKNK